MRRDIPNSVNVECVYPTNAEGLLHRSLQAATRANLVEPIRVGGVVNISEIESKAGAGIGLVQNIDLSLELGILGEC
jgi:hypothetical protein